MDNRTNLDDYLAGLGISGADETEAPPPAPEVAAGPVPALTPADEDPRAVLERFLTGLAARIDPGLSVSVREGEGALEVEITGENAYIHYLESYERRHGTREGAMEEKAFWRDLTDEQDRNPKARCC